MKYATCLLIAVFSILGSFSFLKRHPVLYIIGDSTVKNGNGKGADALWGWGSLIDNYFDTTKIAIRNHAIGGRSSRTFITDGRWDAILKTLKKGDYVIIQFGHNDSGPLDDTARARGTIKGIGDASQEIYNPIRRIKETVYTYGYYIRKLINDTKSKGAVAIVCSPIPRNDFKDGKVKRNDLDYGGWAKQVAVATGAFFVDLNQLIADKYDRLGPDAVNAFFPKDHTHPNLDGSRLNAGMVVQGIGQLSGCDLKLFLKKQEQQ
ncbi:rhamnogalacturonan acetylesterase [Niabella beijingensis]|uniref:rhamnogalacturonan acetylesterase n=1 Tax=Niabella beijingensis TaxID=2872700 RepID=UPI001CBB2BC1|nr:rhamnogalacturonan acetylesterase [Niabella beijingensis]MBZ4192193.1 rhamnogalacturonan acetylesterase [Niabella beijingensis]